VFPESSNPPVPLEVQVIESKLLAEAEEIKKVPFSQISKSGPAFTMGDSTNEYVTVSEGLAAQGALDVAVSVNVTVPLKSVPSGVYTGVRELGFVS
jgi:hypothetical protein